MQRLSTLIGLGILFSVASPIAAADDWIRPVLEEEEIAPGEVMVILANLRPDAPPHERLSVSALITGPDDAESSVPLPPVNDEHFAGLFRNTDTAGIHSLRILAEGTRSDGSPLSFSTEAVRFEVAAPAPADAPVPLTQVADVEGSPELDQAAEAVVTSEPVVEVAGTPSTAVEKPTEPVSLTSSGSPWMVWVLLVPGLFVVVVCGYLLWRKLLTSPSARAELDREIDAIVRAAETEMAGGEPKQGSSAGEAGGAEESAKDVEVADGKTGGEENEGAIRLGEAPDEAQKSGSGQSECQDQGAAERSGSEEETEPTQDELDALFAKASKLQRSATDSDSAAASLEASVSDVAEVSAGELDALFEQVTGEPSQASGQKEPTAEAAADDEAAEAAEHSEAQTDRAPQGEGAKPGADEIDVLFAQGAEERQAAQATSRGAGEETELTADSPG
jgi:hypothetical protein